MGIFFVFRRPLADGCSRARCRGRAPEAEPRPSRNLEAEFRVTGKYDVFALISQSKMKSQRALMTGKLKLKGNMVKALKLASIADRLNKVLATIPAAY